MDEHSFSSRRFVVSAFAPLLLWLLIGSLGLSAGQTAAQTSDPQEKPTAQEKPRPTRPKRPRKEAPPPPANPLVNINPLNGSGNSLKQFDKYGNPKPIKKGTEELDYRRDQDDPRMVKKALPLPLYGYSFFQPARRLIEAKNRSLMRTYEPNYRPEPSPRAQSNKRPGINDKSGKRPSQREEQDRLRMPYDDDAEQPTDRTRDPLRTDKEKTLRPSDKNDLYSDRKLRKPGESLKKNQYDEEDEEEADSTMNRRRRSADREEMGSETDDSEYDDQAMSDEEDEESYTPRRSRRPPDEELEDTVDSLTPDTSTETFSERAARDQKRRALRNQQMRSGQLNNGSARSNGAGQSPERTLTEPDTTRRPRTQTQPFAEDEQPARAFRERTSPDSADASYQVADPLDGQYRNIIRTPPTNYQLAGGDVLTIRYWSKTLAAKEVVRAVDQQGKINLTDAGVLTVSGMTLTQAQSALYERLRRYYKNVEVAIHIKEMRTISVTVTGEAFLPGNFTVPAGSTAFNLLYWAGGPTTEGSLRAVEVQRQGKVVGALDVYKLMATGTQSDIPLQAGDQLYVPASGARVTLSGEVRRPAVFELRENETLQDALRYAGGIKASGVDQTVQVNTLAPGSTRLLKNIDLRQTSTVNTLPLYDGDSVDIFSVRPLLANKVTVEGAVDQPSDYAMEDGMRVADLVRRARGPLSEAYLYRAALHRWNPDSTTTLIPVDLEKALAGDPNANIPLQRWDRLQVYSRQEVAWTGKRKVTVSGAVQRPGVYDLSENMRVSDLLLMIGGPTPEAYLDRAALLHQHGDGSFTYDFISLTDAARGDKKADVIIQDNDRLAVYRVGEAQFAPDRFVTVTGEVVAPGVYPRGNGMKLSDLLMLAGGFKPNAGLSVVVAHARHSLDEPGTAVQKVVVNFDAQRRCAPKDDVPLEDGDVVTIQGTGGFIDKVQTIVVKGAVNRPGPIVISRKGMRLSDALREAGGLRPEAFPDGAEFFRDPKMLASTGQRDLAETIGQLNNLLNESKYKRDLAKSDLERANAVSKASESGSPLSFLGGSTAAAPNPAAGAFAAQLSQRDLVSKPRQLNGEDLQPNGNIAVNIPEVLRRPGSNDDLLLVDGDTITIPEKPTTVQVIGAVVNGRGVLHKPGARMDYYVAQAGGYAPDAAKDRIVIIHAGGGLLPANKVRELRPGDIILVPTQPLAEKLSTNRNGLDSFFRNITNTFLLYRLSTSLFRL